MIDDSGSNRAKHLDGRNYQNDQVRIVMRSIIHRVGQFMQILAQFSCEPEFF